MERPGGKGNVHHQAQEAIRKGCLWCDPNPDILEETAERSVAARAWSMMDRQTLPSSLARAQPCRAPREGAAMV